MYAGGIKPAPVSRGCTLWPGATVIPVCLGDTSQDFDKGNRSVQVPSNPLKAESIPKFPAKPARCAQINLDNFDLLEFLQLYLYPVFH